MFPLRFEDYLERCLQYPRDSLTGYAIRPLFYYDAFRSTPLYFSTIVTEHDFDNEIICRNPQGQTIRIGYHFLEGFGHYRSGSFEFTHPLTMDYDAWYLLQRECPYRPIYHLETEDHFTWHWKMDHPKELSYEDLIGYFQDAFCRPNCRRYSPPTLQGLVDSACWIVSRALST